MFLSILNGFFCVAFVLFAYVNLNDNDSWLWVPIYMVAAICCGLAAFHLYYPIIYLIAMAFYLIYAIKLFFEKDGVRDWVVKYKQPSIVESMQATKPYIEKTREFFGLLIITGALAINYFAVNNLQS
ncbi:MAG TPA: transmembrane 220 family protein [Segetibacter sp.]|nr:transmembrane 220 family protein [Segetibacter sp.]